MATDPVDRPDSRHSWVVAVTGAVAMVFTWGTPMSYGIFRDPLRETFGVSSLALSGVFALMLSTLFIGSGLVGMFSTRFGARSMLLACSLTTAILAPIFFLTDSLFGITLLLASLGLTLGTAFVVVASVVPRWFEAQRGAATGLIFVGNGLGLFVLPPAWQVALTELGVRLSFLVILSVTAVSFALAGLFCRRPSWAEQSTSTAADLIEWLGRIGRTRTFKLVFVGMTLMFAWYQLLAAYAVDLFAHRGLSAAGASVSFGMIGGISIVSRIGGGYLGDRIGSRAGFLLSLGSVAVGLALLFVPSVPVLMVAIALIGLGMGGAATLYIPLLMEIYSTNKDTAIVGVFQVGAGVMAIAMPPLGTVSVTYTDGYAVAIFLTLLMPVVAVGTVAAGTAGAPAGN